ncbi:gluconokinase [Lachancea thermotolerans CBS 6340]|uniref:Gluconokinase n=1 Tax=Lachancea thermotolerans (strain ATCC 56472 / CBS 6340 / NRRL Y-8284) TaxID=559295 RepID=C5DIB2_LACTC|nr:KLTH0E11132p [Lachancea thermotolerans CBS 6340]CAR23523.1 KLTH0E11132p [Lachancea thermotolerans CBS 6340]
MTVSTSKPKVIVLAGTAGTGKSTIAAKLVEVYQSKHPDVEFLEGDSIHPPENIAKMSHGIPLTDEDRWGWLSKVGELSSDSAQKHSGLAIVTCSSLKKKYRDYIRDENPGTNFHFLFLYGDRLLILDRANKREGHFMKANMINSQFSDLELPKADEKDAAVVDVDGKDVQQVLDECVAALATFANPSQ